MFRYVTSHLIAVISVVVSLFFITMFVLQKRRSSHFSSRNHELLSIEFYSLKRLRGWGLERDQTEQQGSLNMSTHETVARWYKNLHSKVISHEFNYSKFSPKRWLIVKFLIMPYFKQQLRFSQEWSNIKIDIRTGLETTFLEHSPSGRVTFRFNSPGFVFTRQRQPLPHPPPR